MHLTLKLEATKPAAQNFLQQQAKFDDCQSAFKFDPSSASNFGSDSLLMQFAGCLAL